MFNAKTNERITKKKYLYIILYNYDYNNVSYTNWQFVDKQVQHNILSYKLLLRTNGIN